MLQPIRGKPKRPQRFDRRHFRMISSNDPDFSPSRMDLDDSFNDAVGRLSRRGIENSHGVAWSLLLAPPLTVKDQSHGPFAGIVQTGK